MNWYEQKQQRRRQLYADRSASLRQEAARLLSEARKMGSVIPFGQPIIVGHHSERSDRAYRARITRRYEQSFEAEQKADYYAQKAASVGLGGISSDDPDAIEKLREKLAVMKAEQALMVAANKIIKKFFRNRDLSDAEKLKADMEATLPSLTDLGLSGPQALQLFAPDFCGRRGYPDYKLTNNNGNMRRVQQRIAELERRQQLREDLASKSEAGAAILKTEEIEGLKIVQDVDENRVLLFFPGKPSATVRAACKRNGFRWSPTRGAWSRMLAVGAIWAADNVKTEWLKEQNT